MNGIGAHRVSMGACVLPAHGVVTCNVVIPGGVIGPKTPAAGRARKCRRSATRRPATEMVPAAGEMVPASGEVCAATAEAAKMRTAAASAGEVCAATEMTATTAEMTTTTAEMTTAAAAAMSAAATTMATTAASPGRRYSARQCDRQHNNRQPFDL
jgi:hypothetical protein